MQNLPNELIVEISKSLNLRDLTSLATTCKNYNDVLHKDIKDLSAIEKVLYITI
jgi:cell division protein FtsL